MIIILVDFLSDSCVAFQSFSVHKSYNTQSVLNLNPTSSWNNIPFATRLMSKIEGFEEKSEAIAVEEDADDEGWGTGSQDFEEKTKELTALQNSRQASPSSRTQNAPEGERDLFIPIFAIVSLLGLFGSYGYEMLRLASQGELYLPWNN